MGSIARQIERYNIDQPYNINLTCVICGHNDLNEHFLKIYATDIFNAGTLIRHKCQNCGLIFGDLRVLGLSEEDRHMDHEDTYSYFSEGDNTQNILNCIKSINIFQNKNYRILDYACGIGSMIPVLTNYGYNICGYDKYVTSQNVLNNIDNLVFDIIYCNNFIEHLINPLEDITNIIKHLTNDGYLIFFSDCLDEYLVEFTHFHTYFYTGNSFNILCDKLGLNIIESKQINGLKIKVLRKITY